jgi:hypothetical protein
MPKKKMSAMAWLECYPFFLVWVPKFQNTLRLSDGDLDLYS